MELRAAAVRSRVWLACALSVPLLVAVIAFMCIVLSFYTPSLPLRSLGGLSNVSAGYRPWKEPARYEASVYASLEENVPLNATRFFKKAQLLWHVGPQDAAIKYPNLRKEVSVDIPRELRSGDTDGPVLFAHVFVQEAGQFTHHPNVADPQLAHAVAALALWRSPPQSSDNVDALLAGRLVADPEHLIAATSVSWAMLLDRIAVDPVTKSQASLDGGNYNALSDRD
ncbi:hypothetical protein H4R20_007195, partial [Coemansia guatemalensis]